MSSINKFFNLMLSKIQLSTSYYLNFRFNILIKRLLLFIDSTDNL